MERIVIEGGVPLEGDIIISGAKNSALKLMAAALLTDEALELSNVPRLADTRFMGHTMARMGVVVEERPGARLFLHAAHITSVEAPYDLVRKMRATFNVLGPLLAREGRAHVSLPGGCAIGARPVDLHLKALGVLGAEIDLVDGNVVASAPKGLKGGRVVFPFISVGATEHAMLASVLARGETVLENAAREPEIADLATCLNRMGAQIEGAGESHIHIQGVERLTGTHHRVVADRIETGTYALAAAMAGGCVRLKGAGYDELTALWDLMEAAGITLARDGDTITISRDPETPYESLDVVTGPYPAFPTDLQAQFMAFMTTAQGVAHIRETIFENRFMHVPELLRMGADIQVAGHEAVVRGLNPLKGAPVMATDLRASVSLVIAALAAEGETVINRIYHLDRGFERLDSKLAACGARIRREAASS